ncbi:MAG: hypothetical protein KF698_02015 [Anaerolineales bacterium]|nr:hypothetical protein [Anaerolineales bacterium]
MKKIVSDAKTGDALIVETDDNNQVKEISGQPVTRHKQLEDNKEVAVFGVSGTQALFHIKISDLVDIPS